jgi:hypothetical protein
MLPAALIACALLCGCGGPALVKVARQDPANPGQYADLAANSARDGVTVYRAGRPAAIALAKLLQPGDEVETNTDSVAVIRYPNGDEVLIDQRTRVRLGSLDVLFGRIFARVKGVFSVESESVIAGVEGTAFSFSVKPEREVSVTVLNGAVVCRSRTGTWGPLRLLESQTLLSVSGSAAGPSIGPASAVEIEQLKEWVTRVDRSLPPPSPRGFCCAETGLVLPSTEIDCRGWFALTERDARERCRSVQPGYCCVGGRVKQTSQGNCRGSFFLDERAALRSCQPAPQPTGYCCANGQISQTTRERCRGSFFPDRYSAAKSCQPRPSPTGYCCSSGRVWQTTRDQCPGYFSGSPEAARKRCTIY